MTKHATDITSIVETPDCQPQHPKLRRRICIGTLIDRNNSFRFIADEDQTNDFVAFITDENK
jgi:hypothetical protein